MNGREKENANPIILDVDKNLSRIRKSSTIWTSINNVTCATGEVDNDGSSNNLSVVKALHDISDATDGTAVSLLVNSGLILQKSNNRLGIEKSKCYYPIHLSPYTKDLQGKSGDSNILNQDKIDEDEVFEMIRNIQDPEHPLTLEQLGVISRQQVEVKKDSTNDAISLVDVRFTPTIPHCSMATLIGLSLRVKLLRSLPGNDRYKVTVRIEPGTHNSELAVNKQLADKERVCAALENKHLLGMVNKCIASGMKLYVTN